MGLEDKALLDLISKHNLNSSQSRELSSIKNDDDSQELFERIIAETDSRKVKSLIMYYIYIDTQDIFALLMSGEIRLGEAKTRKAKLDIESNPTNEDNTASTEQTNVTDGSVISIDGKLFTRINRLAKKLKMPANEFLTSIIDRYEQSLKVTK